MYRDFDIFPYCSGGILPNLIYVISKLFTPIWVLLVIFQPIILILSGGVVLFLHRQQLVEGHFSGESTIASESFGFQLAL